MTIVPDTKNWTWVLERPCPECGFDAARRPCHGGGGDAGQRRGVAGAARPPGRAAAPRSWSALGVRLPRPDVFRLFDERLRLMLEEDDPQFANWDQDETAIADRYAEQDPATVLRDLPRPPRARRPVRHRAG